MRHGEHVPHGHGLSSGSFAHDGAPFLGSKFGGHRRDAGNTAITELAEELCFSLVEPLKAALLDAVSEHFSVVTAQVAQVVGKAVTSVLRDHGAGLEPGKFHEPQPGAYGGAQRGLYQGRAAASPPRKVPGTPHCRVQALKGGLADQLLAQFLGGGPGGSKPKSEVEKYLPASPGLPEAAAPLEEAVQGPLSRRQSHRNSGVGMLPGLPEGCAYDEAAGRVPARCSSMASSACSELTYASDSTSYLWDVSPPSSSTTPDREAGVGRLDGAAGRSQPSSSSSSSTSLVQSVRDWAAKRTGRKSAWHDRPTVHR